MREIASLSGLILSQTDLPTLLEEVCRISARALPGTDGASILTVSAAGPSTVAMDDWSRQLDELQFSEHEGPCLDAYRTGAGFRIRDVTSDTRWPSYLPRAAAKGVRSMMSTPLTSEGTVLGALNLYSRRVDAFDVETASLAEIVAAHTGLATQVAAAFFGHRDLAEQLADAMRSRAVIEQAKGVLAAALRRDPEDAWQDLVRLSQRSNRKLRDVAADVVALAAKGDLDVEAMSRRDGSAGQSEDS